MRAFFDWAACYLSGWGACYLLTLAACCILCSCAQKAAGQPVAKAPNAQDSVVGLWQAEAGGPVGGLGDPGSERGTLRWMRYRIQDRCDSRSNRLRSRSILSPLHLKGQNCNCHLPRLQLSRRESLQTLCHVMCSYGGSCRTGGSAMRECVKLP